MADDEQYHTVDALSPALKGTSITGSAGIMVAAVQATLTKQNIGALGAFSRYGPTIAVFAATGGVFEFTRLACANLRQRQDAYNQAVGGFFSGACVGLRFRTIPAVLGFGTSLSIIMAALDFTGGSFYGFQRDPNVDEYERKNALRANKRRPIGETLEELGEGRGIYGPGYDERRRERIKQRYGIDVPSS